MRKRFPGLLTLLSLLLAVSATEWVRSRRHTEIVAVSTRAEHVQGLANDCGGVLLLFSGIPFGPEKAPTADFLSVPALDFHPIHDIVYDADGSNTTVSHRHFLGFHQAHGKWLLTRSAADDPAYNAVAVPYWFLVAVLSVPVLPAVRR